MRVLLNGVATLRPKTGVGQTTMQLYSALVERFPAAEFWLYPGSWWRERLSRLLARPAYESPPGGKRMAAWRSWLRQQVVAAGRWAYTAHFQWIAHRGRFDLYHEPNLLPLPTPLPTVTTVHDMSVLLHPQWHPADRVRRYKRAFDAAVRRAAHIIVDSHAVRREVLQWFGLPESRVSTVYCGVAERFRPPPSTVVAAVRHKYHLPQRYFLCVGTIEPRKNLLMLLQAYCQLPAALREECGLVLCGPWGWKSEPERTFYEQTARHSGVRHLGYVIDEDLPALYAGAAALLYPSHYEGFGLPPLEMMACGGAAIVSTADAVREVAGPCAPAIDPNDQDGWFQAMRRTIVEPHWLDAYRRHGPRHASRFRWSEAAENVMSIYCRVLGLPSQTVPRSVAAA